MMNLSNSGYTEDRVIKELCSSNRHVWFEYTVQDSSGKTIGSASITNASVGFDSTASVMRTFKGTMPRSELVNIDTLDHRIVPWFCLKVGDKDLRWALGKFIINPSESCSNGIHEVSIVGYDLSKLCYDDRIINRMYIPSGSVYTSYASQIVSTDVSWVDVDASELSRAYDMEWEIGTRKLDIANELLTAINYNPIHFDEYGKCIIDKYALAQTRPVEMQYKANEQSIIVDGINKASNKFEVPNMFVRYVDNPDAQYMISTYKNEDPESPYSIQNRGRTIVDSESINDIATQTELNSYAIKCASEAMQHLDILKFKSLTMPCHGFRNCLYLNIPLYEIDGKYIETAWEMELKAGGTMSHTCEKVVIL